MIKRSVVETILTAFREEGEGQEKDLIRETIYETHKRGGNYETNIDQATFSSEMTNEWL